MNRPNYPLDPNHVYNPNIPIILDDDFVEASEDVNPRFTQVINNMHFVKRRTDSIINILGALIGLPISGFANTVAQLPNAAAFAPGTYFVVFEDEIKDGKMTLWTVADDNVWEFVKVLEIDLSEFARLAQLSNTNILHNWDFRGANPNPLLSAVVNQRGQNAYTLEPIDTVSRQYTFDRWYFSGTADATASVSLQEGFIRLSIDRTGGGSIGFSQLIEFSVTLSGDYTLSFLIGGEVYSQTYYLIPGATPTGAPLSLPNGFVVLLMLSSAEQAIGIHVILSDPDSTGAIDIQAVKLEKGAISTLANASPMDFGRELAVCQRYQLRAVDSRARLITKVSNTLVFNTPVPTTMRINPIPVSGLLRIMSFPDMIEHTGFNFITFMSGNEIQIAAYKPLHGLSDASLLIGNVVFDANL